MTHATQKITAATIAITILVLTASGFSVANAQQTTQAQTQQPPTARVVGGIPTEYNTIFSVEWSGGSLYQLKANLATQGCIVDDVVVTENGRTLSYSQYEAPSTDTDKLAFLQQYQEFIPAGIIQTSCYNICELRFTDDPTAKEQECMTAQQLSQILEDTFNSVIRDTEAYDTLNSLFGTDEILSNSCSENSEQYKEKIAPLLPALENVCVVRAQFVDGDIFFGSVYGTALMLFQSDLELLKVVSLLLNYAVLHFDDLDDFDLEDVDIQNLEGIEDINVDQECLVDWYSWGECLIESGFISTNIQPIVTIYDIGPEHNISQQLRDTHHFHIEVHEMCHINQYWQVLQFAEQDRVMSASTFRTKQGEQEIPSIQELMSIVGFVKSPYSFGEGLSIYLPDTNYSLPQNSIYRDLYGSDDPFELAAELCALYLLDKVGADSFYHYGTFSEYNPFRAGFSDRYNPDFQISSYLTPKVKQWVEKYALGTRSTIEQSTAQTEVNSIQQKIDAVEQHLSDWKYNNSIGGIAASHYFENEPYSLTIITNAERRRLDAQFDPNTLRTEAEDDVYINSSLEIVLQQNTLKQLTSQHKALSVFKEVYGFTDQDLSHIAQDIKTLSATQVQENYYSLSKNRNINDLVVKIIVNGYDDTYSDAWGDLRRTARVIITEPLESVDGYIDDVRENLDAFITPSEFHYYGGWFGGDEYIYTKNQRNGNTHHDFSIYKGNEVLYTISLRENADPARINPFDEVEILFQNEFTNKQQKEQVKQDISGILTMLVESKILLDYWRYTGSSVNVLKNLPLPDNSNLNRVLKGDGVGGSTSLGDAPFYLKLTISSQYMPEANTQIGRVFLSQQPAVVQQNQEITQKVSAIQNEYPRWTYEQDIQEGSKSESFGGDESVDRVHAFHTSLYEDERVSLSNDITIVENADQDAYSNIHYVNVRLILHPELQNTKQDMLNAVQDIVQISDNDVQSIVQIISQVESLDRLNVESGMIKRYQADCMDVKVDYTYADNAGVITVSFVPNQLCLERRAQQAIQKPILAIKNHDHIYGNQNAKVFLIQYSDLQCPSCGWFYKNAQSVVDEYDGQVAWAYRHYSLWPNSEKIAEATECVAELKGNNAFWEYTSALFATPIAETPIPVSEITLALIQRADELGISESEFTECIESNRHATRVQNDKTQGSTLGVVSTPYAFIVTADGTLLDVLQSSGEIRSVINTALRSVR